MNMRYTKKLVGLGMAFLSLPWMSLVEAQNPFAASVALSSSTPALQPQSNDARFGAGALCAAFGIGVAVTALTSWWFYLRPLKAQMVQQNREFAERLRILEHEKQQRQGNSDRSGISRRSEIAFASVTEVGTLGRRVDQIEENLADVTERLNRTVRYCNQANRALQWQIKNQNEFVRHQAAQVKAEWIRSGQLSSSRGGRSDGRRVHFADNVSR